MDVPTPIESESMSLTFEPWPRQLFLAFWSSFLFFFLLYFFSFIFTFNLHSSSKDMLEVFKVKRTFENV